MANTTVNKVIMGSETLIDLTGDSVTADSLLSGYTAHAASGARINGNVLFHIILAAPILHRALAITEIFT